MTEVQIWVELCELLIQYIKELRQKQEPQTDHDDKLVWIQPT